MGEGTGESILFFLKVSRAAALLVLDSAIKLRSLGGSVAHLNLDMS